MVPKDRPDPSSDDESELLREMYWARDTAARARMDTPEIRDHLHDFAAQMRTDEAVLIPMGEGNPASPSKWRRQLKRRLWRVMRPVTWRYDRLLADHAELTTSLAEKVMVLEAEVDRLKAERGDAAPRGDLAGEGRGPAPPDRVRARRRGDAYRVTGSAPCGRRAMKLTSCRSPASGTRRASSPTRWRSGGASTSPRATA